MSAAHEHAAWLTLVQVIVCDAIEDVVVIHSSARTTSDAVRLWIGRVDTHHTAWFDVSVNGEITATTRGNGARRMLDDVSIDDIGIESARLLAWVQRGTAV